MVIVIGQRKSDSTLIFPSRTTSEVYLEQIELKMIKELSFMGVLLEWKMKGVILRKDMSVWEKRALLTSQ